MLKRILQLMFAVMLMPAFAMAQNTTSGLTGFVKNTAGEPLVGATVVATHEPTGTVYKTQTRAGGSFYLSNMNPGGPYTIEISFTGLETDKKTDIYLSLGETLKSNASLSTKTSNLGNVTVVGTTKKPTDFAGRGGTETMIGRDKMENLPTVGRNIHDYLRAVPQARLTQSEGAVSIAGQNNRFNAFYVDGAVNNDVFGLSASGTNGGQAAIAPLSIDAIDQFQVVISPYDASLGNFTGGGINAISRSGTNKTQGSIYYFWRNQDLAGKTPTGDKSLATKLPDFKNQTYGFRLGGALIKNKLFYFLNGEIQKDVRPQPFDSSTYVGNTRGQALMAFQDTLLKRFGYDAGGFMSNDEKVSANRITARIDWNVNDKHKVSVSHRYTKGERENASSSSTSTINFRNNGFFFPTTTNSTSFELKSVVGRSSSNRLLITYTSVKDDRGTLGQAFPRVRINDGSGALVFGTDNSSTQNLLTQKNFSIFDAFKFNVGKHALTIGTDNEFNNANNVFIQNTYGNYTFANLAAFYNNLAPTAYSVGYPIIDNKLDDNTEAAAKFKTLKLAAFFNDEYRPNDRMTWNFGIRADYFKFVTTPVTDAFTNDSALVKFGQYHDLRGARSGQSPNIPISLSPRVGFTYKIPEENLVIRGGMGIFTGRIPLVWPGGIYNNTGTSQAGFTANAAALAIIRFRPDPFGQWRDNEVGISLSKGPLNLISKEFRMPKIFRASLAADKKLGNGWTATVEGVATINVNEIYYTNINILPPIGVSVGPGSRTVYGISGSATAPIPIRSNGTNPYDNAILLHNNDVTPKGFAYNLTFSLDKRLEKGWSGTFNYTYGNSLSVNEATSSVNLSQWRFMETVNGKNGIGRSLSDFNAGHRIFAYISKKFTYAKNNLATTISLVYTGQSGSPISYVYSNNSMVRDDGNTSTNDLIYVPTVADLQAQVFLSNTVSGVTYTPQQQKDALNAYIENDPYLKNRRGQFSERNAARLPFTNIVDLKIAQDINIKVGKNRYQFQLTYDMFNFTNFLNRNWGRNYFQSNDQFGLIQFAGYVSATNLTPQYRFNPTITRAYGESTSTVPQYSARWISQLGIRFNFN